jgi:hypothetical protein
MRPEDYIHLNILLTGYLTRDPLVCIHEGEEDSSIDTETG